MKRNTLTGLLILIALLALGCGQMGSENESPNGPIAPPVLLTGGTGDTYPEIRANMTYETFTGTLSPNTGGALMVYSQTWPGQCMFSILVPQEAMGSESPTTFTLSFPDWDSYQARKNGDVLLPLILRLGPDGHFNAPITIRATWMPGWDKPVCEDFLAGHYVEDGVGGFQWEELSDECEVEIFKMPRGKFEIQYQVDHFSDWDFGPPLGRLK